MVLSRENGLATVMYDVKWRRLRHDCVMTHDLGALSWSPLTGAGGTKRKLELQPSDKTSSRFVGLRKQSRASRARVQDIVRSARAGTFTHPESKRAILPN